MINDHGDDDDDAGDDVVHDVDGDDDDHVTTNHNDPSSDLHVINKDTATQTIHTRIELI